MYFQGGVTSETVEAWIEQKRLLAWQRQGLGLRIPAEQILGSGQIVTGIQQVLQTIPEPRLAWEFLSRELPFFNTPQRPIDALKAGQASAVMGAIPSYFEAFTYVFGSGLVRLSGRAA